MTAKEFMFGYSSSLMTLGNNFLPNWINFDKLGLIDRMYNFEGDYETVYNGQKLGLENIGLIEKYRGETKLPQWDSPCGDITGASDGTKFKGYTQPNDTHLFFRKSMCRAKKLNNKRRSTYQEPWIEDELVYNIDRKLSSYIPEKSSSLTAKELEVYMDSMVPLTDDIHKEHEHSQDEHEITNDQSVLVYD
ncbi:unnamed protein product [Diabrotica balteata]|uniref:Uncharacterized protein n=1 Tax=Diabrotica balteata TaxID=107213 RepID=A0A9N9XE41_DIABA|nr:unnamed protein product [Diabrotica balteata]